MSKPRIGIIISTTREGRFGERAARWVADLAAGRNDIETEIVDLRDYPLPFFEYVASPRFVPIDTPEASKWSSKLAELDGYVFVTAEYNHSISGVLKNALDFVFAEPARKPAAFVGLWRRRRSQGGRTSAAYRGRAEHGAAQPRRAHQHGALHGHDARRQGLCRLSVSGADRCARCWKSWPGMPKRSRPGATQEAQKVAA